MTKVVLYSDAASGLVFPHWTEEWRGDFDDYVIANYLTIKEAIEIGIELAREGVYRTGGGAAPIFELRLDGRTQ